MSYTLSQKTRPGRGGAARSVIVWQRCASLQLDESRLRATARRKTCGWLVRAKGIAWGFANHKILWFASRREHARKKFDPNLGCLSNILIYLIKISEISLS